MTIDLSPIMKDYGEKLVIKDTLFMEDVSFLGELFSFKEPLQIDGSITNNTKSFELLAQVTGNMEVHCARCNKPLTVPVTFDVREILAQDGGAVSEDEDLVLFSGTKIDLGEIVMNSFLMQASGKYLCKDDCKGLCPHCGADLNEQECACEKEEIDPRWAALADILKKTSDTE